MKEFARRAMLMGTIATATLLGSTELASPHTSDASNTHQNLEMSRSLRQGENPATQLNVSIDGVPELVDRNVIPFANDNTIQHGTQPFVSPSGTWGVVVGSFQTLNQPDKTFDSNGDGYVVVEGVEQMVKIDNTTITMFKDQTFNTPYILVMKEKPGGEHIQISNATAGNTSIFTVMPEASANSSFLNEGLVTGLVSKQTISGNEGPTLVFFDSTYKTYDIVGTYVSSDATVTYQYGYNNWQVTPQCITVGYGSSRFDRCAVATPSPSSATSTSSSTNINIAR